MTSTRGMPASLAVWTYDLALVDAEVDRAVHDWYRATLADFWPPERVHVETRYRDTEIPYAPIPAPSFDMRACWTRSRFVAYLHTWSAVTAYQRATGRDALEAVTPGIDSVWNDDRPRDVRWPLKVLAGSRPLPAI